MQKKLYEKSLNGSDWILECVGDAFPSIHATVPGNIQSDLENALCLKPIWYGMGDERIWEVARHDWWYHKDFIIPDEWKRKRIKLCMDGVDYSCDVFIDKQKIISHDGQYERFSVEITKYVNDKKNHRLSVLIHKMPPELEEYIQKSDGAGSGEGTPFWFVIGMNKTRQVLRGLKSITNFSYDWGTNIWTLGLWKDVILQASEDAMINDLYVKSELNDAYDKAFIRAVWEINSLTNVNAKLDITLTNNNNNNNILHFTHAVSLKAGDNKVVWEKTIDDPELWWPAGHGKQPLYILDSKLYIKNSSIPSDGRLVRFGICDLKWGQLDGIPENFINPLKLTVNGRRIRTMGSNMSSPDLLHGRAHNKGRIFVQRAIEAGFNTLRMHGGQIIFTEDFYDACDEMGIMLSIEFPVGNCMLEEDEDIVAHWSRVVLDIVKLLRNHPCIIEWSGGNEMAWQQDTIHPALTAAREIISKEDGRFFRATCPAQGVRHAPWDYNPLIHYKLYNSESMRDQTGKYPMMRNGEFGVQTPNNIDLLKRTIPPKSRFPINKKDPILIRKNMICAAFNDEVWLMPANIEQLFGKAETFEELIIAGQWMAAEGLRYAFDALRLRTNIGGFTNWCLNEPWPNGAGSFIVDYEACPLPVFYAVGQSMKSISICLKYDSILYDIFDGLKAEIFLVNDGDSEVEKLHWSYILRDRHGDIYGSGSGVSDIGLLEAKSVGCIDIQPPLEVRTGPVILELYLKDSNGDILTERVYAFGAKGARAPLAGLIKQDLPDTVFGSPPTYTGIIGGSVKRTKIIAKILSYSSNGEKERICLRIENIGDMTALYVEIHPLLTYRPDVTIKEQFGFIPPGEYRDIIITSPCKKDLTLPQTGWYITSYNADPFMVDPQDVIFWIGRQDFTCEGFYGFNDPSPETLMQASSSFVVNSENKNVLSSEIPYLWEKRLEFQFNIEDRRISEETTLYIYSADQSYNGAEISITLNNIIKQIKLSGGYGHQKYEPWHLASPKTTKIDFGKDALKEGINNLIIEVTSGWITIDAMNLSLKA